MPLTLRACIALLAALAVAPAAADAASVVRPTSVSGTAVLTLGPHTLRTSCPAPSVALNGAVVRKSPGVTVRRSTPGSGAGDWRIRVFAGNGGSRVRTVLRCVRLEVPSGISGARLDVKTRREPVAVPAGGTTAMSLRCGRAWAATGYGFGDPSGRVRLASVVPSAHGWDFVLENTGPAATSVDVSARCLRQTARAGSAELRFRISRPSRVHTLGTDSTPTLSHACGRGVFSLATGSIVDPLDSIALATAAPFRNNRARWTFRNASGGDRVRTFLVCLSRSTGFG
jgi:hypothetical protein